MTPTRGRKRKQGTPVSNAATSPSTHSAGQRRARIPPSLRSVCPNKGGIAAAMPPCHLRAAAGSPTISACGRKRQQHAAAARSPRGCCLPAQCRGVICGPRRPPAPSIAEGNGNELLAGVSPQTPPLGPLHPPAVAALFRTSPARRPLAHAEGNGNNFFASRGPHVPRSYPWPVPRGVHPAARPFHSPRGAGVPPALRERKEVEGNGKDLSPRHTPYPPLRSHCHNVEGNGNDRLQNGRKWK